MWEWAVEVDLQRRLADWVVHIFRQRNREADFCAEQGVTSRQEWTGTVSVFWSEVANLCRFWDGSCERSTCCDDDHHKKTLDGLQFTKKCGPMPGWNSLDAKLVAVPC